MRKRTSVAVVALWLLALCVPCFAAGIFTPGLPQAGVYPNTWPLTGNEQIPADTLLPQGVEPQSEAITTGQLQQWLGLSFVAKTTGNISGSKLTTTGNIGAGSTSLKLAAAQDFATGQGVTVLGAGPAFAGATPTITSVTQVGAAGATTLGYQIVAIDGYGGHSAASATVTTTTSNATLSGSNYNSINFTLASGGGVIGAAVYRSGFIIGIVGGTGPLAFYDSNTGAYGGTYVPVAAPVSAGNTWLSTTIAGGGGTTTLVLAAGATNAVVGATVLHDDTVAVQASLTKLCASGGVAALPAGTINLTQPILLGNGTGWGSGASTCQGVGLRGVGPGQNRFFAALGTPSSTIINWLGGPQVVFGIFGTITGVELSNFTIEAHDTGNWCLYGQDVNTSVFSNIGMYNCPFGVYVTTAPGDGNVGASSAFNHFTNLFWVSTHNGYNQGVTFTGSNGNDSYYNFLDNIGLVGVGQAYDTTVGEGIYLGAADSIFFHGVELNFLHASVNYDYTVNAAFPSGTRIDWIDQAYGGAQLAAFSSGTPDPTYSKLNSVSINPVNGALCSAYSSVLGVVCNGKIMGTPTLGGNCGAGAFVGANGTANSGVVAFGSGSPTVCTVTFKTPFLSYAFCTAIAYGGTFGGTVSINNQNNTKFDIDLSAGTSSAVIVYTCIGE